jgi:hypothetical protein
VELNRVTSVFWKFSRYSWFFLFFILLTFGCTESNTKEPKDLSLFSEAYLRSIQQNEKTTSFQDSLQNVSLNSLTELCEDNEAHLAFWLNIYNASVQVRLTQNLDKYAHRERFFNERWISIGGKKISLNDIELGILGREKKGEFIGKLQTKHFDSRIHFALNCGAASCPPIRVYTKKNIHQELDAATRQFLLNNSSYTQFSNTLKVDELLKWYATDFEGTNGIIALHQRYGIVPLGVNPTVVFSAYDWKVKSKAFDSSKTN